MKLKLSIHLPLFLKILTGKILNTCKKNRSAQRVYTTYRRTTLRRYGATLITS